jgi:hypothetical protein
VSLPKKKPPALITGSRPSTAVTAIGTTSVAHSTRPPAGAEAAAPASECERREEQGRDQRHQVPRREANAREDNAQQRQLGCAHGQRGGRPGWVQAAEEVRAKSPQEQPPGRERGETNGGDHEQRAEPRHDIPAGASGVSGIT